MSLRAAAALAAAAACVVAGCGEGGSTGSEPRSATTAPPVQATSGRPEGVVALAAPPGTFTRAQLTRFAVRSGCHVDLRPLAPGAGGQAFDDGADVVLARSDEAGALVQQGRVAPLDRSRIPGLSALAQPFRRPAATTLAGSTYGVPVVWSALVLLSTPRAFPAAPPASWKVLYEPGSAGRVAVLDDPLVIAAAARYLGVERPFVLAPDDLRAALSLLRDQQAQGVAYLPTADDVERAVQRGGAMAALGLPTTAGRRHVSMTVPPEGTVGWTQDLLVAPGAAHTACAYRLLAWAITPAVQVRLALATATGPVNPRACELAAAACRLERSTDRRLLGRVDWAQAPGDPLRPRTLQGKAWAVAWDAIAHAG